MFLNEERQTFKTCIRSSNARHHKTREKERAVNRRLLWEGLWDENREPRRAFSGLQFLSVPPRMRKQQRRPIGPNTSKGERKSRAHDERVNIVRVSRAWSTHFRNNVSLQLHTLMRTIFTGSASLVVQVYCQASKSSFSLQSRVLHTAGGTRPLGKNGVQSSKCLQSACFFCELDHARVSRATARGLFGWRLFQWEQPRR